MFGIYLVRIRFKKIKFGSSKNAIENVENWTYTTLILAGINWGPSTVPRLLLLPLESTELLFKSSKASRAGGVSVGGRRVCGAKYDVLGSP